MTTKRTFSVTVTTMPCSCGGVLRPRRISGKYDATVELGIPAEITGTWMGVRCDTCGKIALPGKMLEVLSEDAVLLVLGLDRCLSGRESQFLRKAALGIGQVELARRLGLTRATVARWEASRSLSGEHDFELRALVAFYLLKVSRLGPGPWKKRGAELIKLVTGDLDSARTSQAPARPPPLRIAA